MEGEEQRLPLLSQERVYNAKSLICGCSIFLYNILVCSFALFVLFAAYNTLQNYATSLFPGNLGYISLGVLYFTVCVVIGFTPPLVARYGEKLSMIVGGVLYVVYLGSIIYIIPAVVIVSSVLDGFGAALLWVAQGVFLVRYSPPNVRGKYAGIFWSIFQLCNVLGNASAYFVFDQISERALFIMFCILGVIGVLLLFLIRELPPSELTFKDPIFYEQRPPTPPGIINDKQQSIDPPTTVTTSDDSLYQHRSPDKDETEELVKKKEDNSISGVTIMSMLRTFRNPDVALMLPVFFWLGFELAFWTGEFTRLVDSDVIGLVLMFTGIGEVLGSMVLGYLSDRLLGRVATFIIGASVYASGMFLSALIQRRPDLEPMLADAPWAAYVAAFGFGIGDSVFNTQVFALLGHAFLKESIEVFTINQLFQNFGSAVGYFYSPLLPVHGSSGTFAQLYIQAVLLVIAVIVYSTVHMRTRYKTY